MAAAAAADRARDQALFLLRLGLGTTFLLVGLDHVLVGRRVLTSALAALGFPGAEGAALGLAWAEVAAGALLLAGALLPAALAITVLVNTGAIFVYAAGPRGTLLYADVAMLGVSAALLAWGAGRWSVDARLPAWLQRWPRAEGAGWLALRMALALSLLLGAALAFRPVVDGYAVIDARLPLGGAPLAALLGAAAGALTLLGLAPMLAAAMVVLLELLALTAFGLQGGATGYLVFQLPTLAAALAIARLGPGAPTAAALLARSPRLRREPARTSVAAALVALLLLGTVIAGAGRDTPAALAPTRLFEVRAVELGRGEAFLGEGDAWIGQVPVANLALRDVTATLTWADDEPGSAPDEFTLELVPPDGLLPGAPAEGAGGSLEIRVPVYRTPPARAEAGLGQWNLRVYLRSAGDASTMALLPGLPDEGNAFELVVRASVFEPR